MTEDNVTGDVRETEAARPAGTSRRRRSVLAGWVRSLAPTLLGLLGGFAIGAVVILVAGESPLKAYGALLKGALGNPYNLAATIVRSLPIITTGLGASVALTAGLWNIGAESQMLLGALGAVVAALYLPLPGLLRVVIALAIGVLIAASCGLLVGWFQTQFKVPILLGSLLTNYLFTSFISYMVGFPLRERGGNLNQTPMIDQAFRLPRLLAGANLHAGVFIVLGLIIVVAIFLRRTVLGYELRVFGANAEFAIVSGVNSVRMTLIAMLLSGGIAGLAGGIQVLGVHYRLIEGSLTTPAYAWSGLMAAILSKNDTLGIVATSIFFAAIQTGASGMERATNVPSQLSSILQAVMILLVGTREILSYVQSRRKYEA